jgi:hypothetical protein
MSRIALGAAIAAIAVAASCSKSAKNQEPAPLPSNVVPAAPEAKGAPGTTDQAFRLKPEEGQLAIEVAGEIKAGVETVANVVVTPGPNYKINFEYPTKLKLDALDGVTIAKPEQRAGGQSKDKGDAEAFEEKKLAFAVKLVPAASGSYTINGSFKFAVCDKDQCLAKKEPIAIQVAAK